MSYDPAQWKYPTLAKPASDGMYCYHIQRRISVWFSTRLADHITPNAATGIDLFLGISAAVLVLLDYWLWAAVLVQAFGIFSCVDGEIARIQDRASRIGDFLDTMTDRGVELVLLLAIAISLGTRVNAESALAAALALLGGVFLLTASSEKFRSTYQMGYPKRRLEKLFSLFCGGADSRLLLLSIALVVSDITGDERFLLWLVLILAALCYLNFIVRIGLVYKHFGTDKPTGS